MPEMPDGDWKRLVLQHSERAGRSLSPDVVEELAEHVADVYTGELEAGRSESEARSAAEAVLASGAYGDIAERQRARAAEPSRLIERAPVRSRFGAGIGFDVRYAWRSMRRQPAFSLAVLAILAIGIGAATAAFTVIDAVLLRPLPYPRPRELVVLRHVTPRAEGRSFAAADWRDYAARHGPSLALAAYASWPMNVTGGGEPERLRSVIVSGNFFEVIGQAVALGRAGTRADDEPSAPAVAVLSHGFWQRRFGGDPAAVGRPILLNGRPATIIGVMPPGFAMPAPDVDLWSPMGLAPEVLADRAGEWLSIVGRVGAASDLRTVQADLDVTSAALAAEYPKTNTGERAVVRPLLDELTGEVRRPLWLGGLAVLFVLLTGCANAANLMIARATLRRDEIAIRSALGADPLRLARQLLVESTVLASIGGALGIAAAAAFLRTFTLLADGRVPRLDRLEIDATAVLVAVGVSLLTALLFGGAAAWLLVRDTTSAGARADLQRSTRSSRLGGWLLAGQVAFAMMLVAGAMVVARGYARTARIDAGFDTSNTVTMQLTLPRGAYPDTPAHVRFAERALAEITGIPGVAGAGIVTDLPFVANAMTFGVRPDGSPADAAQPMTVRPADPGFFRTLRIPRLGGRLFDGDDRAAAPLVAVLNRSAADRLDGDRVIGTRVQIAGEPPRTVVGVVGDIKHGGLHAEEGPVVYVPYAQKTFAFANWIGIVARTPDAAGAASSIKSAIARVDPNQPVHAVRTMADYVARETAPFQFSSLIVGTLAGAALLIAIAGIYGLTAFIVGRRSREMGVRMALGATRGAIVWLVLRQIAVVIAIGATAGAAGSVVTNGMLRAALAETAGGADALALVVGVTLFAAAALLAALAPALRAGRIDPKAALQAE